MGETKICTKCLVDKPLSQYRPYTGRGKLGLRPLCKECQRAYEKQWRSNSKECRREARKKRAEKAALYAREYRAKNRAFYLVGECKRRSLKKAIPFDLDSYILEIQTRMNKGYCELTGVKLYLGPTKQTAFNTPSIDRIVPELGYVYQNIRIVCFAVNAMMGNWGEAQALEVARSWVKKTGGV